MIMRLIDADKMNLLLGISDGDIYAKWMLDHMDTVDAVPVTRCRDCANFRQNASGACWCDEYGGAITPNDYCSRAVSDKQPRASIPWEAD